jgi:hypothetical protein
MVEEFSVSCPRGSYITEISGRADATSVQGIRLSCSDGSLLYAYDTGSGTFVTNTHIVGYSYVIVGSSSVSLVCIWPQYYVDKRWNSPREKIGAINMDGSALSGLKCAYNTTEKFTGVSGLIDINNKEAPIKDIKTYFLIHVRYFL